MFARVLASLALLAAEASATIYYAGVAESGGEFGAYSTSSDISKKQVFNQAVGSKGTGLPGTFGVDYQFIKEAAIDTYVDENHVCPRCLRCS